MILVEICLDGEGILKSCKISGHSNSAPAGSDIICSAVSILARTALRVLSQNQDISLDYKFGKHGEGSFSAACKTPEAKPFLRYTGNFFIEGIKSIAAERPDNCRITFCSPQGGP